MKVLVIDDDAGLRKSLGLILGESGHEVVSASDGEEGLGTAHNIAPDIILCDVKMPRMNGLEFLDRYREEGGEAPVLVMTAYGSRELAVEAVKAGASDYIPKPFGADEVMLRIAITQERHELREEVGRLRQEVRADARFGEIVARSKAMLRALEVAQRVAPHDSPVLISGNTGTGKELVARLIHRESPRGEGPFIAVNCGAVPENLLESEFFGHVKGAFTGADRDKPGLFEAARGGSLFLDEVGELPGELQVKLLRALQEGEVRRVGSTESLEVDVRIISATNRDLERAVKEDEFRPDLYYRLAVVPIHLPPLRERTEEIPDLVRHLLERHRKRLGLDVDGVAPDTMEIFLDYTWPGNIRELENVLERALVLSTGGEIQPRDLPEHLRVPTPEGLEMELHGNDLSVKRRTADLERHLIEKALERTEGNRTRAAELLDLSPRALRYKIKDYGLS